MTNEIDLGQQQAQSFKTYEEAMDALHKYAQHHASVAEDEDQYEIFMSNHQIIEIQQTSYAIALKPGVSPFTLAESN